MNKFVFFREYRHEIRKDYRNYFAMLNIMNDLFIWDKLKEYYFVISMPILNRLSNSWTKQIIRQVFKFKVDLSNFVTFKQEIELALHFVYNIIMYISKV